MSARPAGEAAETVEIWIQGQRFEVKTDSGRDMARKVARYVNEKIVEASAVCGAAPRLNLMVLVALNLVQDHLALLDECRRMHGMVEEKSRRLVGSLEELL
ncbi:MAG: cell division protein ZapA [Pseudomonadota bacterium]